jgi:chorismate mutase
MNITNPAGLDEIRREIDRLDEGIHQLLIERGAIIDRLIATKGTTGSGIAFRPLREAQMMRRLVARHRGGLPIATVEHLWRVIISVFTHLQAPYALHVDGSAGFVLADTARFMVGFDVPLVHELGPAEVAEAVAASAGDLGLVAICPSAAPWWQHLQTGRVEISARLPFIVAPGRPAASDALVLSRPLGEAAATEVPVVALSGRIRPELGGAELLCECTVDGMWHGLVACDGVPVPAGARPVGSYARPIVVAGEGA